MQKVLESANLKVGAIVTDPLGVSGRAMLEALIAARQTPAEMGQLAPGRLRGRLPAVQQALEGRVPDHHRCPLRQMLAHLEDLSASLAAVRAESGARLGPFH